MGQPSTHPGDTETDPRDIKMDIAIGYMLRTGVLVAAAVVLLGGVLYLKQMHGPMPDYRVFHGVAAQLTSPKAIVEELKSGDSHSIIQFGLLLLIATPIGRVLFAVGGFGVERDKLYTAVSLIVFAILMYSLFFR